MSELQGMDSGMPAKNPPPAERRDALTLENLDATYTALLEDVETLSRQIKEQKAYALALAGGDLSVAPPENNPLCVPLIVLHKKLNALAKQAQQAARGKKAQRGPSLGILSQAIEELILVSAAGRAASTGSAAAVPLEGGGAPGLLAENNRLLVELAGAMNLGLTVMDMDTREVRFENQRAKFLLRRDVPECAKCARQGEFLRHLAAFQAGTSDSDWSLSCAEAALTYRVNTRQILWDGRMALAHLLEDVGVPGAQVSELAQRMNRDDQTGLYGERLCLERIDACLRDRATFSICYFAIDSLDNVRGAHGGPEGDAYVHLVVDAVRRAIRGDDFFGRVEDNAFIVLFRGTPAGTVEAKFDAIQGALHRFTHASKPYPVSISYVVLELKKSGRPASAQAVLQAARARLAKSARPVEYSAEKREVLPLKDASPAS